VYLEIGTTHRPATDLGFLLHKHPDQMHLRDLGFGRAIMVYPEASAEVCRFVLTLDIDPIALARSERRRGRGAWTLGQYVNDRPYAASSMLSVAISRCLGQALGGRSRERQALADQPLPFQVTVAPIACRGGEAVVERLFGPLAYTRVEVTPHPLDPAMPDWGDGPYATLRLAGELRLATLLEQLYVLIPVLDNRKHYWVERDELDKLLAKGGEWLRSHPERTLIAGRYLKRRQGLVREALERLSEADGAEAEESEPESQDAVEEHLETPLRLHDQRLEAVVTALRAAGAKRVVDLGCGSGKLLRRLLQDAFFVEIVGVDVSPRALDGAEARLHLERMPAAQKARLRLLQGALTYRDRRIEGYDAYALVEVIEHIDPPRLPALEQAVFGSGGAATVIVTTPNRDYNAVFERDGATAGFRHPDHRFEWTRVEFAAWIDRIAQGYGYSARCEDIGEVHPEYGPPTQMAVFVR